MKKILFPTDFSKTSNNAFAYTCLLAEELDAQIDLIHIYNIPFSEAVGKKYDAMKEIWDKKSTDLELKMKEMVETYPSFRVRHQKLIYGVFVSVEIADFAKNENYDLIVMGMKGEHNRGEKFVGTVTTDLMMKAPCPILAVPENALFEGIENMAFATDLSPSDELPIEQALDFAENVDAELHFVYIDNLVRRPSKVLSSGAVDKNSGLLYTKVLNPSIIDGLDVFLKENPTDLLCLYIPHRRLWERLFHFRTSKAMAFHTDIPLLVFKEK